MAETTPAAARTSNAKKAPSIGEILNPLNPGTVTQGAGEIGKQAGEVFGGNALEKAGESIGHSLTEPISKALGQLVSAYGLRLGEILAGAALILFGLVTIGKGGSVPRPV